MMSGFNKSLSLPTLSAIMFMECYAITLFYDGQGPGGVEKMTRKWPFFLRGDGKKEVHFKQSKLGVLNCLLLP